MKMTLESRKKSDEELHEVKEEMQIIKQMLIQLQGQKNINEENNSNLQVTTMEIHSTTEHLGNQGQKNMNEGNNSNPQVAAMEIHSTTEHIANQLVCNDARSSKTVGNPRAFSSSSIHVVPSLKGVREVTLLSPRTPNLIVARATILSKDPCTKVRDAELGPNHWEVNILVPIVRQEPLPRPFQRFKTIGDTAGASIAWPTAYILGAIQD